MSIGDKLYMNQKKFRVRIKFSDGRWRELLNLEFKSKNELLNTLAFWTQNESMRIIIKQVKELNIVEE